MSNATVASKAENALNAIRHAWNLAEGRIPFIAFSGGKDSLAVAAIAYEALAPKKPICVYVHHDMEFPETLDYVESLRKHEYAIDIVHPHLGYFELMERGIGFLTRQDAWCVPMLVGTGLLDWLKAQGATSPRDGVMFRGMSGSEYSHKFHAGIEIYDRLELPCVNPLLDFSREEILDLLRSRYDLPLNPLYEHMDRTYCICCHTTADPKKREYSEKRFPEVCAQYYRQIEEMLFNSGLIDKCGLDPEYATREEKLDRHGFVQWRRSKLQESVGAVRYSIGENAFAYRIRQPGWIDTKHLLPVQGKWHRKGTEIRFHDLPQTTCDTLIKRMINCLDCGFCMIQCFAGRTFDCKSKSLSINGCRHCGKCISLKHCMGWNHRFWRRVIVEAKA